jgi:hypothetical protein
VYAGGGAARRARRCCTARACVTRPCFCTKNSLLASGFSGSCLRLLLSSPSFLAHMQGAGSRPPARLSPSLGIPTFLAGVSQASHPSPHSLPVPPAARHTSILTSPPAARHTCSRSAPGYSNFAPAHLCRNVPPKQHPSSPRTAGRQSPYQHMYKTGMLRRVTTSPCMRQVYVPYHAGDPTPTSRPAQYILILLPYPSCPPAAYPPILLQNP